MNHKKIMALLAAFVSSFCCAQFSEVMVGDAYLTGQSELYYQERHSVDTETGRDYVKYLNASGEPFASKVLDFSRSRTCPDLHVEYLDDSLRYGAQWQQQQLSVFNTSAGMASKTLDMSPSPMAIDAGLSLLIQDHYDQLMAGQTIQCEFVLAMRLSTVKLSIVQVNSSELPVNLQAMHLQPENITGFEVKASHWLVRAVAPLIYFVFDKQTRKLVLFHGPASIASSDGETPSVNIRYRYLPDADLLAELQAR